MISVFHLCERNATAVRGWLCRILKVAVIDRTTSSQAVVFGTFSLTFRIEACIPPAQLGEPVA